MCVAGGALLVPCRFIGRGVAIFALLGVAVTIVAGGYRPDLPARRDRSPHARRRMRRHGALHGRLPVRPQLVPLADPPPAGDAIGRRATLDTLCYTFTR
jgi:hypothetical protein